MTPPPLAAPLLQVENMRIALAGAGASHNAVEEVSFEIGRGEAFGLVGESGCGKSITALAVMGLLRRPLSLAGGRIVLDGEEIQDASAAEMRRLRGKKIGMIFQEPMTALNPLSPVGRQIAEMFVLHQGASWNEAMDRAEESLRQVHVPSPERRISDYPHQLSGGMRKRTSLAQTLALDPDIILMDEPFSALDIQTRQLMENEVLDLWAHKKKAVLFITHDLDEAIAMSDRVVVLSAGPASHPIGEFSIDIPRPRDVAEIKASARFIELHAAIWAVLRDEVLKGYAQQLQKAA